MATRNRPQYRSIIIRKLNRNNGNNFHNFKTLLLCIFHDLNNRSISILNQILYYNANIRFVCMYLQQ
uniref:Histidine-rich knob protein n=1 Tax=Plasmodium brasilianum TaxID=5824 RepID=Q25652_PLABR|nr:histidine-rich knob protein [Plasmodium brasilianum]